MSIKLLIPPSWPPPFVPKLIYVTFKPSQENPNTFYVKTKVRFDNLENGQNLVILQHMQALPNCFIHQHTYVEQPDLKFSLTVEYCMTFVLEPNPEGHSLLTYLSWDTVNFTFQ